MVYSSWVVHLIPQTQNLTTVMRRTICNMFNRISFREGGGSICPSPWLCLAPFGNFESEKASYTLHS